MYLIHRLLCLFLLNTPTSAWPPDSCMIKRVETYHIAPTFVEGPDSLVQLLDRHRHLDWGA